MNQIRYPRQKRGQDRFDAILAAAESLLEEHEPGALSIYSIAERAQLTPPSIYHFFPDSNQVFIALAERILMRFAAMLDTSPPGPFATWLELSAARFQEGLDYYNSHAAARRLLLGSGLSAAIRARDLDVVRQVAERSLAEVKRHFIVPDLPDLVDRFNELVVINDAMWALSVHRHGLITPAAEIQARRAREAYSRTFLPEFLPPNPAAATQSDNSKGQAA